MKIGLISIDGCIPNFIPQSFFADENELFIVENRALEITFVPAILQQKTPLTILSCVCALTEETFYIAQIDALKNRCDVLICFAQKDCKQLQWCLEYAQQIKLNLTICWG